MIKIPSFCEAMGCVEDGTANPLHIFVYSNEPAGDDDEYAFREQLQALLDWIKENK